MISCQSYLALIRQGVVEYTIPEPCNPLHAESARQLQLLAVEAAEEAAQQLAAAREEAAQARTEAAEAQEAATMASAVADDEVCCMPACVCMSVSASVFVSVSLAVSVSGLTPILP